MVFQPVGPESPDVYWRRRAVLLGVLGVALVFVLAMCARGGGGGDARAVAATASASADASSSALGGGLDDPASPAGASTNPSAVAAASGGAAVPTGSPTAAAGTRSPTPLPTASGAVPPASSAASGDAASAAAMDPAAAELASSAMPASPGGTPTSTSSGSPSTSAEARGTCAAGTLRVVARTDAQAYGAGGEPQITLTVTNAGAATCTADLGSAALSVVVTSGPDRIWSSDDCGGTGTTKLTPLAAGASWSTSVSWSGTRSSPGHCANRVPAKPGFYEAQASAGGVSSAPYRFQMR